MTRRRRHAIPMVVAAVAAVLAAGCTDGGATAPTSAPERGLAWSQLLGASRDLGPAHEADVALVADLTHRSRPLALTRWAAGHRLHVRWLPGQRWAVVSGPAASVGAAFGVDVHDYVTPTGRPFYAAARQPGVPPALTGDVAALGRVGFVPIGPHGGFVAPGGLSPKGLLQAYDALRLANDGYDGAGQTVVIYEWSPPRQGDLDQFAQETGLPQFTPEQMGNFEPINQDWVFETNMDVEAVHAVVPKAKIVVVASLPTLQSPPTLLAPLMAQVAQRYPGAVWSSSIWWGCDQRWTWPELTAVNDVIASAEKGGSSFFVASGDTSGYECRQYDRDAFANPPASDGVGVEGVGSAPATTSVSGTTLSVTTDGDWYAEQPWVDVSTSDGTGGGVSTTIPRPDFQSGIGDGLPSAAAGKRVVPDVSAIADPYTGFGMVNNGGDTSGGGTSLSAPVWAGLTALMNSYLEANGGHAVGAFNPVVYALATGHPAYPPMHDVTVGGNALYDATPGYDPVTGWGTPDTWNLVRDVLAMQKGGG